jgi:hypothetical protein
VTPIIRLAVDKIPSFAPKTAARSQPLRLVRCCARGNGIANEFERREKRLRRLVYLYHAGKRIEASGSVPQYGAVDNLRADWRSALGRVDNPPQDTILPHKPNRNSEAVKAPPR